MGGETPGPQIHPVILRALQKLGVKYKFRKNDIVVPCLMPGHNEKKASMYIHATGKAVHCFGCGYRGSWNSLAKTLGLEFIEEGDRDRPGELLADLSHMVPDRVVELPKGAKPWPASRDWRQVPGDFLATKCDARLWYDSLFHVERILLPIVVQQVLRGWVSRALAECSLPHRNLDGSWVKLFGLLYYDHLPLSSNIALVEGLYDATFLRACGIPTVAICGVENWSSHKKMLVQILAPEMVWLVMDGDKPGQRANGLITKDLLESDLPATRYILPDDTDPGRMLPSQICHLREVMGL